MTDRELLELAARAAGIELLWDADMPYRIKGTGSRKDWDPLHDDGDALRLAVRLNLSLETDAHIKTGTSEFQGIIEGEYETGVEAWNVDRRGHITKAHELYQSDPYAATRRAITRAAAEIGKGMT